MYVFKTIRGDEGYYDFRRAVSEWRVRRVQDAQFFDSIHEAIRTLTSAKTAWDMTTGTGSPFFNMTLVRATPRAGYDIQEL